MTEDNRAVLKAVLTAVWEGEKAILLWLTGRIGRAERDRRIEVSRLEAVAVLRARGLM